jgi:dienelactone hydrolase
MRRPDRGFWIALLTIGFLSATILSGCNSGAIGKCPGGCPLTISISFAGGTSQTVVQGQSLTIAVTVLGDASGQGVTWRLSGPGALAKQNSTSVEYDAPASGASNVTASVTATAVVDTTKSGTLTVTVTPPPPISVSVSPSSANVETNTGLGFTATVLYDAANAGVAWTLTQGGTACSPGCGTLDLTNTASGALTTYTAPATVPANPTVTLTATSITDTTKSASAVVTVVLPPISVSVGPRSVLMGVNATQQFIATVQNDPADKGVTWTLTDTGAPCSPGCGTIAPASTVSGEAATYTAPATAQPNKVTLSATSVAYPTKSSCPTTTAKGCARITVTNGTVKLVPASLDFGRVKVGTSSPGRITLTNTGAGALTITSVTITGTGAAVFSQTDTCGGNVGAGNFCIITATFSPVSPASLPTADIIITDSSADSPQQVPMSGKGSAQLTAGIQAALSASATAAAPSPTGPSVVGTRVMPLVDSSRRDPYVANGTMRELLVRFWYPASLAQGCKLAEYTSPRVWNYFSELIGVRLPVVTTNSCMGAPVADGQHPIVVFTHGYTGTFTDYTFLFEDLASRGYIVASVDHTYEATAVEFPDGRFVESIPGSHFGNTPGNDASELAFAVSVRLDDLKFVVNELKRLNEASASPFAGKLEISRIALAGHSLGGVTALLGVEADPRIKAGIILDGVVPETSAKPLTAPIMLLSAGREQWSEAEQHLWDTLRGPRFAVGLRGGEHVTPSDLIWLAGGAIKTGKMGPAKTIAAIRDYIAAFLNVNLRDQLSDRLLTGPSSDYPDAVVITKAELLCCTK